MKISKQANTHYLFVGGISPYMSEEELKNNLGTLGPISEVILKKRSKAPFYNLGYGIVSTRSYGLYQELMQMHFYHIDECKLEFKEYKDPKDAIKSNTIESVNFSILLHGLEEGMTDVQIEKAIKLQCPTVKVLNIVMRKNHTDGLLRGEAKVIFGKEQDVIDIRSILPLEIYFKAASSSKKKKSYLFQKNPYQTEKALKKLQQLEREGLIHKQSFSKFQNPLKAGIIVGG